MSVLVYLENWNGKFKKSTKELLTYASDTANLLGTEMVAVSIGNVTEDELKSLEPYGLGRVLSYSSDELGSFKAQAYTAALHDACEKTNASTVILGNTYNGKSMGPRLAAKWNASIATAVISLPDTSNGFSVTRNVFSNKGFGHFSLIGERRVITLNGNSYKISENAGSLVVEDMSSFSADAKPVNITDVKTQSGKIPLTEAELVVSAGRGLKGPENWTMIEELADLLNAGTACSKPVSDVGWRPHSEHVGQTGITISPNLYIAIGISGAIQHLAGVSSSKVICVINKDPEAPFFKAADYGIVGDAFEVVPKLIEAVKALN